MAMTEDVGGEMAPRLFGHMLRYGEVAIRRAVPLALALNSISNPKLTVLETLNKYAHDLDVEVSIYSPTTQRAFLPMRPIFSYLGHPH